ncbi:MAG: GAF domain-containing protein [Chloroflexota bacterium]
MTISNGTLARHRLVDSDIDEALFAYQEQGQTLEFLLKTALQLSNAEFGTLRLLDQRTNTLELRAIATRTQTCLIREKGHEMELEALNIMASVAKTKKTERIGNLNIPRWWDKYSPFPLPQYVTIHSVLAVPILSHDGKVVVGVLNIESQKHHAFSIREQHQLEALAKRALFTIHQTLLLEAFQMIGQITLGADRDRLLTYVTDTLTKLMLVPVCSIWLTDGNTDKLQLANTTRHLSTTGTTPYHLPRKSFIGQVFDKRDPVRTPNVVTEPVFIYRDLAREQGWKSAIVVPILSTADPEAEVLGAIFLCAQEERHFTDYDTNLIMSFSHQVAIALKQNRLLDAQDRELRFRNSIQKVNDALISGTDLDSMLDLIVSEATELLQGDASIIYLKNQVLQHNIIAATTENIQHVRNMTTPLDSSLSGWVAENNEAVICDADDKRIDQNIAKKIQLHQVAAAPLAQDGVATGTLIVAHRTQKNRHFQPSDLKSLKHFAAQAKLAINRMQLQDQAKRQAEQIHVINKILEESLQPTIDTDELVHFAACQISDILSHQVDIGLAIDDNVIVKTTARDGKTITLDPSMRNVFAFGEGMTGTVAQTGQTMIAPNTSKEPCYYQRFSETQSAATVPFFSKGKILGVLNLESRDLGSFTEETAVSLETLAASIALALENAQRQHELSIVLDISRLLHQSQSFEDVLEFIQVKMKASATMLFVANPKKTYLTLVQQSGLSEQIIERVVTLESGQYIAGKVLANGEPLYSQNLVMDPRAEGVVQEEDGLYAIASIPIKTDQGSVLGVLNVLLGEKRPFLEHEQKLLDAIAKNFATAMQKTQIEQNYHRLFTEARDAIVILNLDGTIHEANQQTETLTGFGQQRLIGKHLLDLTDNSETAVLAQKRITELASGKEQPLTELAIRDAYGRLKYVESNATPIIDEYGRVTAIQSIWRDVTNRHIQKAEIQKQNRQLQGLVSLNQLPFTIPSVSQLKKEAQEFVRVLLQGDMCFIQEITDYRLESTKYHPTNISKRSHSTADTISRAVAQVILTGQALRHNHLGWLRGDGSAAPSGVEHLLIAPMKLGEKVIGTIRVGRFVKNNQIAFTEDDQTYLENFAHTLALTLDYLRLDALQQKQYAAKQVLEHMSLVSNFLGHKLGGFLGAVALTTRELRRQIGEPGETAIALMANLEHLSQTATDAVNQIRQMEKPLHIEREAVSLKTALDQALANAGLPGNIDVIWGEYIFPNIWGSQALFVSIFEGLICNATEAMPNGGRLIIRSRLSTTNDEVLVDFEDTGSGVASHLTERIFDPFFSTKEVGRGMGVGLWLTQLYLHSVGGDIKIDSDYSDGARFTVHLPAMHDISLHRAATVPFTPVIEELAQITIFPEQAWPNLLHKVRNVLIVEDDHYWQNILSIMLDKRQINHTVVCCKAEAEEVLTQQQHDFYIVDGRLADYDSHNVDGLVVVEKILARNDQVPILFLSSWAETLLQAQARFGQNEQVVIVNKQHSKIIETVLGCLRQPKTDCLTQL